MFSEVSRLFPPFFIIDEIKQDSSDQEEDQDRTDAPACAKSSAHLDFGFRRCVRHQPVPCQQGDLTHQHRSEDDCEFSQHVEETIILGRLIWRNEP